MAQRVEFKRIGVGQARALLDGREVAVFDVRDANSFSAAHIDGASRVSEANLGEVLISLPKGRPVLIYCYHGNASQVYAQMFVDFGFSDVYSMDGGFEAWRSAPRERRES